LGISHVLITRPEPECSQLAELLTAPDLVPIQMPAFGFEAVSGEVDPHGAWRNSEPRLAVFTSPRSVEFGLASVPPDFLDDALLAAIGPATASLLSKAGLRVAVQSDGAVSTESLLQHPALTGETGFALIFAAPGGRDALRAGLAGLGWEVSVAMVYRRVPLPPDPGSLAGLADSERLISVWTSGNALEWALEQVSEPVRERLVNGETVVISSRLAEFARQRGASRVLLAAGPDNLSIREAVLAAHARTG
jgi:uroporphyrinogen-III synthase